MSFLNNNFLNNIEDEITGKNKKVKMHLRLQQRNGRKCVTILEGIFPDLDAKKILQKMKGQFACGGCVKKDDNENPVLTLTGDQRKEIIGYFLKKKYAEKSDFVVHGY